VCLVLLCGSTTEVVHSWSRVGHIISKDCDDKRNTQNRRSSFIFQVNNILFICVFGKLDCVKKMRLFKACSSSFYGSELWDLANDSMETLCKTIFIINKIHMEDAHIYWYSF